MSVIRTHLDQAMTACRWIAFDQPRILPGRHAEDCPDRKPKPKGGDA